MSLCPKFLLKMLREKTTFATGAATLQDESLERPVVPSLTRTLPENQPTQNQVMETSSRIDHWRPRGQLCLGHVCLINKVPVSSFFPISQFELSLYSSRNSPDENSQSSDPRPGSVGGGGEAAGRIWDDPSSRGIPTATYWSLFAHRRPGRPLSKQHSEITAHFFFHFIIYKAIQWITKKQSSCTGAGGISVQYIHIQKESRTSGFIQGGRGYRHDDTK